MWKIDKTSLGTLGYIGFGVLINNTVPIYDLSIRTVVSILFYKWVFNITLAKRASGIKVK